MMFRIWFLVVVEIAAGMVAKNGELT